MCYRQSAGSICFSTLLLANIWGCCSHGPPALTDKETRLLQKVKGINCMMALKKKGLVRSSVVVFGSLLTSFGVFLMDAADR